MPKTALITGITGQDGAYLAEFLLAKGYTVHGIKRRTSLINTDRIDHLYEEPHVEDRRLILHHGDLTDSSSLVHVMQQVQPDEVYNLGSRRLPCMADDLRRFRQHLPEQRVHHDRRRGLTVREISGDTAHVRL
jgi:GDP-mannose 4,6-dehydratase